MHHACFIGVLLVCLCSGRTFPISELGEWASNVKDCLREAPTQEGDEASMLQVKIDTQEEHQNKEHQHDEAKTYTTQEGHQLVQMALDQSVPEIPREAPLSERHHIPSQDQNIHKKVRTAGSGRVIRSFIYERARITMASASDVVLPFVAIIVGIFSLVLCIGFFLVGDQSEKDRGSIRSSSPFLQPVPSHYSRPNSWQSQLRPSEDGRPYQGSPLAPARGTSQGSPLAPASYPASQKSFGGQLFSASAFGTLTSMYGGSSSALSSGVMQSVGMPLCPSLMVPEGTRLSCVVGAVLRRQKQSLGFQVRSVQATRAALFKVEVQELGAGPQAIALMSLDGQETLASVSTQDLWSLPDGYDRLAIHPALCIYRPSSVLFGTVQKSGSAYIVKRGQTPLLSMVGDFRYWSHNVKVVTPEGKVVASATQNDQDEYKVVVQPGCDAGLVLLCLLSADKLEGGADDEYGGTSTI